MAESIRRSRSGQHGQIGLRRAGRVLAAIVAVVSCAVASAAIVPQPTAGAAGTLTCAEMEQFLKTARLARERGIPVGVTFPSRATLDNGTFRHDAAIQTVDIQAVHYPTTGGTELNFRDTWKFNVVAYELAKLLGLNMVPPYVERMVRQTAASVSWWIGDAMMERDRLKKKIKPPDADAWNRQMYGVRLFHELAADRDFNATNVLITKEWRIWMIDFSRAFRLTRNLERPNDLKYTDRRLLTRLGSLDRQVLRTRLGRWLTSYDIDALLARRDSILAHFEREAAARGEAAVFHHLDRLDEPCGAGLE